MIRIDSDKRNFYHAKIVADSNKGYCRICNIFVDFIATASDRNIFEKLHAKTVEFNFYRLKQSNHTWHMCTCAHKALAVFAFFHVFCTSERLIIHSSDEDNCRNGPNHSNVSPNR